MLRATAAPEPNQRAACIPEPGLDPFRSRESVLTEMAVEEVCRSRVRPDPCPVQQEIVNLVGED